MESTDDLSQLMPNLRGHAQASSVDTFAVREYLRGGPVAALPTPPEPARELLRLQGKLRSGRQPERRSFGIQWRPVVLDGGQQVQPLEQSEQGIVAQRGAALGRGRLADLEGEEDEEQLKDQLLARFLRSSRGHLVGKLRTQRQPTNRHFGIRLLPVVLPPPPEPEPEPQPASPVEDQENATAAEAAAEPHTAAKAQPCWTPASSALGRTPMEGVPERFSGRRAPPTARKAAATPFTPMKGVPEGRTPLERLRVPATARKAAPTPFTPMEGIPEGRTPLDRRLPNLRVPGSRAAQDQAQQSVDSPIMGVVQQAALGSSHVGAAPLNAAEPASQLVEDSGDYLGDGGFDYGGNDEPSAVKPLRGGAGAATPGPPRQAMDAAVQTGVSLRGGRGTPIDGTPGAAAELDGLQQPDVAAGAQDEDGVDYDDYDHDAGGFDYDDGQYEGAEPQDAGADWEEDGKPPANQDQEPAGPAARPEAAVQRHRRQTLNPGTRLRNELKRKSLGANPRVGRQEVAPGVRRSTRQKQEPLQWWRGEIKHFSRKEHKTMPTVEEVVQKPPNTPWRTVSDIYRKRPAGRPQRRRRQQQQQEEEDMDVDS